MFSHRIISFHAENKNGIKNECNNKSSCHHEGPNPKDLFVNFVGNRGPCASPGCKRWQEHSVRARAGPCVAARGSWVYENTCLLAEVSGITEAASTG